MHHELFLALLGHTGDVIERRPDGFFIRHDATFLSKAQHCVLNRLLHLGYAASILTAFVQRAATLPSVYVHALSHAIERVLDRYTDAVVALEAKTLQSHAVFPLSDLMFELDAYRELLPAVCTLVHRITGSTTPGQIENCAATCRHGAKVLSLVYQSTQSGFPRVRHCMHHLLSSCHRVWFHQMMAWMVYGEIVDPHHEFFIQRHGPPPEATSGKVWHDQFTLALDAVPLEYMSLAVAQSVFGIGKAVHILTRAKHFSPHDVQTLIATVSTLAQRPVFDPVVVEREVEHVRQCVATRVHDQVIIASNFIGYLHVLKDWFFLSRGHVFQTFIARTFSLMRMAPTRKSQDVVNHGAWRESVCALVPLDEPWCHDFDLQLPLQTFAFHDFASTDQLRLFNVAKSCTGANVVVATTRCPDVQEPGVPPSGTVWWRHAQRAGNAFVTEFTLQWDPDTWKRTSHCVALLLRQEGTLGPAPLVDGSFELHDAHVPYVGIDVTIESLDGTTTSLRVSLCGRPSSRCDEGSSPTSPVMATTTWTPKLCVRIQYARQEATTAVTRRVTYTKMMAVFVNETLLLETPLDLEQRLRLDGTTGEYQIGLGLSTFVQLRDWKLAKYPATASWRHGKCVHLQACSPAVPARDLWRALRLRCHVPWPLQLVVTPDLVRSYGHVFQLCFSLKRVAHALDVAWTRARERADPREGSGTTGLAAEILRSCMSFVVRTLETYVQVFVIQPTFNQCIERVSAAGDFDRAKRVHETFVASLVTRCYVRTHTVSSALDDVLTCCWDLVEYMLQDEWDAALSLDRLALLDRAFHGRVDLLYRLLQLSDARDLLFLLDSNGYFAAERERRQSYRQ